MDFNVKHQPANVWTLYKYCRDLLSAYQCWHVNSCCGQQIMTKKYGKMKHPQEESSAGRRRQLFVQYLWFIRDLKPIIIPEWAEQQRADIWKTGPVVSCEVNCVLQWRRRGPRAWASLAEDRALMSWGARLYERSRASTRWAHFFSRWPRIWQTTAED